MYSMSSHILSCSCYEAVCTDCPVGAKETKRPGSKDIQNVKKTAQTRPKLAGLFGKFSITDIVKLVQYKGIKQ